MYARLAVDQCCPTYGPRAAADRFCAAREGQQKSTKIIVKDG